MFVQPILRLTLCLLLLQPLASIAQSVERAQIEELRATTMALIQALVEANLLPKEKAEALIKDATAKGIQAAIDSADRDAKTGAMPGQRAPGASAGIRVPFVPEPVKAELREQLKADVIEASKRERWARAPAPPDWLDRIQFEGDLRVRYQTDSFNKGNGVPADYFQDGDTVTNYADLTNSQSDLTRLRLRARLAANIRVADWVTGGFRISTGNTTSPVSTSSTSGTVNNRFGLRLDRAFARLVPLDGLQIDAGRIANPFFSTEIQHAADLGFDGVAMTYRHGLAEENFRPFVTGGLFPLRDNVYGADRRLAALQLGADWQPSRDWGIRAAFARYDFKNAQGSAQTNVADPAYLSSEYESGFRQRGNTLFKINQDPSDPRFNTPTYGLASKFQVNALTLGADYKQFDPFRISFTGEWIENVGFNENEILTRTGSSFTSLGKRNRGNLYRLTVGNAQVLARGDWQIGLTYRYLERDATPDAFTDADFLLGGTNNKGYVLGALYGIERNTSLGLRFLSAQSIDGPTFNPSLAPLRVNTLQMDLNMRF